MKNLFLLLILTLSFFHVNGQNSTPGERHNEVCEFLLSKDAEIQSKGNVINKLSYIETLVQEKYGVEGSVTQLAKDENTLKTTSIENSEFLTNKEKNYLINIRSTLENFDWEGQNPVENWIKYINKKIKDLPVFKFKNETLINNTLDIYKNSSFFGPKFEIQKIIQLVLLLLFFVLWMRL